MSKRSPTQPAVPAPLYHFTAGPYRVNYCDTDRMGHAWHGQYLIWFECARTDLLRSLGSSYKQWEDEHGILLPVTECAVQYRRSANYDDLLLVDTRLTRLSRATATFDYHLRREADGELLATATTRHAFIDAQGRVIRRAPEVLPQFFGEGPRSPD